MEAENVDDLQGQAEILEASLGYIKSMLFKTVTTLGIPDAIAARSMDAFLTLDELATAVSATNKDFLHRIMRFLVLHKIFAEKKVQIEGNRFETGYGLTPASKWLVTKGSKYSLAPLFDMTLHEVMVEPWFSFHECLVKDKPTNGFINKHGKEMWEFTAGNPEFSDVFNKAMACTSLFSRLEATLQRYHGFEGINTLVDVGGGLGALSSMIVSAHPNIKCINFDLPHVVAKAPVIPGVEHVGGDMFEHIPRAEAIVTKLVLHDWADAKCMEILKNCYAALPENGKLIILDMVLDTDMMFSKFKMNMDMLLMNLINGKERTQEEWVTLLSSAGFARVEIHTSPTSTILSIIEAFKA